MVLPGHLAGGYLVARAILDLAPVAASSFSPTQIAILIAIGTICGDGPDIDLIFYSINQRSSRPDKDENGHRHYITHTPIFWLALSLFIAAIGYLSGSLFIEFIGCMVLAGSWTHLIIDSIEFGIRWLWPFSDRRFALMKAPAVNIEAKPGSLLYHWLFVSGPYKMTVTFYAEILITIISLWVAFHG